MTTVKPKSKMPVPTEEQEQIILFNWARLNQNKYPELKQLFHIPNGGARSKTEAARFKAAGVKAGVPDIFLPAAKGPYNGLFIELKRMTGGRVSEEQKAFIAAMHEAGYAAVVACGWKAAAEIIENYLSGNMKGEKSIEN